MLYISLSNPSPYNLDSLLYFLVRPSWFLSTTNLHCKLQTYYWNLLPSLVLLPTSTLPSTDILTAETTNSKEKDEISRCSVYCSHGLFYSCRILPLCYLLIRPGCLIGDSKCLQNGEVPGLASSVNSAVSVLLFFFYCGYHEQYHSQTPTNWGIPPHW